MELKLEKLASDSRDREYFEAINNEAFPAWERLSFEEIFRLAEESDTDVLGIYEGGAPAGFAVLLRNDTCGYLYYLAIEKSRRSHGCGGAALKELIETYSDIQIILDFEELDENAENYAQRLRRKQFYLRNGLHETGHYTLLSNERFEVVCSGGELRREALKDLLRILHRNRPEFPELLL